MNEHTYILAQFKKHLIKEKTEYTGKVLMQIASLEADFVLDGIKNEDIGIIAEVKRWLIKRANGNDIYSYEREYYKEILFYLISLEVEAVLGEDDLQAQEETNA